MVPTRSLPASLTVHIHRPSLWNSHPLSPPSLHSLLNPRHTRRLSLRHIHRLSRSSQVSQYNLASQYSRVSR